MPHLKLARRTGLALAQCFQTKMVDRLSDEEMHRPSLRDLV